MARVRQAAARSKPWLITSRPEPAGRGGGRLTTSRARGGSATSSVSPAVPGGRLRRSDGTPDPHRTLHPRPALAGRAAGARRGGGPTRDGEPSVPPHRGRGSPEAQTRRRRVRLPLACGRVPRAGRTWSPGVQVKASFSADFRLPRAGSFVRDTPTEESVRTAGYQHRYGLRRVSRVACIEYVDVVGVRSLNQRTFSGPSRRRWPSDDQQRSPGRRRLVCGVLAVTVLSGLGLLAFIASKGIVDPNPFDDEPFVGDTWKRESRHEKTKSPRGRMAESARLLLLSRPMRPEEVEEVLGTPDVSREGRVWRYWLGFWSGYGWDPDVLEVEFSEVGVVGRVRIVQT